MTTELPRFVIRGWVVRLIELDLVRQAGRTKGVRYFVPPALLRAAQLDRSTTLVRIEPHRLRALIIEDVGRYPDSTSTEVLRRIGPEIPIRTLRRALNDLVAEGGWCSARASVGGGDTASPPLTAKEVRMADRGGGSRHSGLILNDFSIGHSRLGVFGPPRVADSRLLISSESAACWSEATLGADRAARRPQDARARGPRWR